MEQLEEQTIGPTRQCRATNRDGVRCKNWAMHWQTVCGAHGGKAPTSLKRVQEMMLFCREPAIAALYRAVQPGPPCPHCGNTPTDAAVIRAAQIILDRTGFGPTAKLEVETSIVRIERIVIDPRNDTVELDALIPEAEALPDAERVGIHDGIHKPEGGTQDVDE